MTDFHDYNTPEEGEKNWHAPLNENFRRIDRDIEIRDEENNRKDYTPKSGAKYFSTDSGSIYIGDGNSWNKISYAGQSSEFSSLDVSVLNKTVYAGEQSGDDLSEKLRNSLDTLDRGGRIVVTPPDNGKEWTWASPVSIDPTDYDGLLLQIDAKIQVTHSSGFTIKLDSNGDINTQLEGSIIELRGGTFDAAQSGDIDGFLRMRDITGATIKPTQVRQYRNSTSDATALHLDIGQRWCEVNDIHLVFSSCDRGLYSSTGNNASFQDNILRLSGGAYEVGAEFAGDWTGSIINPQIRLRDSNGVGYRLNGKMDRVCIVNPGCEGGSSDTAFETGSDYSGMPILLGGDASNVGTVLDNSEGGGDVLRIKGRGISEHELEFLGGSKMRFSSTGQLTIIGSDGEKIFTVRDDKQLNAFQSFRNKPKFLNGFTGLEEDLRGRNPEYSEVAFHDGSGNFSRSLCFEKEGKWYNIVNDILF